MNNLLNNINTLHKQIIRLKELSELLNNIGSMVIIAPSEPLDNIFKTCAPEFGFPYFIVVDKQNKPINDCISIFNTLNALMNKTQMWSIKPQKSNSATTFSDSTLTNISTYFSNNDFTNVKYGEYTVNCNNLKLNDFATIKNWDLVAISYQKLPNNTFKYSIVKRIQLYPIEIVPPNTQDISYVVQWHNTVKNIMSDKFDLGQFINNKINIDNLMLDYFEKHKYPPYLNNIHNNLQKIPDIPNLHNFKNQIAVIVKLIEDSSKFIDIIKANINYVKLCKAINLYTTTAHPNYININKCLRISGKELDDDSCTEDTIFEDYEPITNPKFPKCNTQGKAGVETITDIIKAGNEFFNHPNVPKLEGDIIVYRSLATRKGFPASTMFEKMDLGTIIEDRTFMSTSLKFGTFVNYETTVVWKIIIPKGTPVVYIGGISENPDEHEVLLRPGSGLELIEKGTTIINTNKQKFYNGPVKMYTLKCAYCNKNNTYKLSVPPRLLLS